MIDLRRLFYWYMSTRRGEGLPPHTVLHFGPRMEYYKSEHSILALIPGYGWATDIGAFGFFLCIREHYRDPSGHWFLSTLRYAFGVGVVRISVA